MPSAYNIKKDPQGQRALSSLLARQSMGAGKRQGGQGRLRAQLAGNQFGRQLGFEQLALQKKASDQRFAHSNRMYGMQKKNLKNEGKMMGLQTALGIGGVGLNYLEGKRRAGIMAADRKKTDAFRAQQVQGMQDQRNWMQRQKNMYGASGSYMRGGM